MFLVYRVRRPNEFGPGLIARLEPLDYDDGEPED
jgi:hypothetical protein